MTKKHDFGTLYRSAFAERDPERKQMLLTQVQTLINKSGQDELHTNVKLGPQAVPLSNKLKIAAVA
jgi:hypothetical protein